MKDYIVRATAANNQIRAFAATTRDVVETARQAHNTSPVATAALGRLLTGGAMMGTMMKNEKDLLTIQIKCEGPIKGLTVTADVNGNVKGYVENPDVMLPPSKAGKLDVAAALDLGVLSVIKDMGLKEPYVEQVPSSVGLGVLMEKDNTVKQAGGFIIQVMPFVEDAVLDKLEENIKKIDSVTAMLDKGYTPEQILETVLEGMDVEFTDTVPTRFYCNCTKERVEKAIVSIGKKDIQEMIDDGKEIEVNCHFCNTNYKFTVDELKEIIKRSR